VALAIYSQGAVLVKSSIGSINGVGVRLVSPNSRTNGVALAIYSQGAVLVKSSIGSMNGVGVRLVDGVERIPTNAVAEKNEDAA